MQINYKGVTLLDQENRVVDMLHAMATGNSPSGHVLADFEDLVNKVNGGEKIHLTPESLELANTDKPLSEVYKNQHLFVTDLPSGVRAVCILLSDKCIPVINFNASDEHLEQLRNLYIECWKDLDEKIKEAAANRNNRYAKYRSSSRHAEWPIEKDMIGKWINILDSCIAFRNVVNSYNRSLERDEQPGSDIKPFDYDDYKKELEALQKIIKDNFKSEIVRVVGDNYYIGDRHFCKTDVDTATIEKRVRWNMKIHKWNRLLYWCTGDIEYLKQACVKFDRYIMGNMVLAAWDDEDFANSVLEQDKIAQEFYEHHGAKYRDDFIYWQTKMKSLGWSWARAFEHGVRPSDLKELMNHTDLGKAPKEVREFGQKFLKDQCHSQKTYSQEEISKLVEEQMKIDDIAILSERPIVSDRMLCFMPKDFKTKGRVGGNEWEDKETLYAHYNQQLAAISGCDEAVYGKSYAATASYPSTFGMEGFALDENGKPAPVCVLERPEPKGEFTPKVKVNRLRVFEPRGMDDSTWQCYVADFAEQLFTVGSNIGADTRFNGHINRWVSKTAELYGVPANLRDIVVETKERIENDDLDWDAYFQLQTMCSERVHTCEPLSADELWLDQWQKDFFDRNQWHWYRASFRDFQQGVLFEDSFADQTKTDFVEQQAAEKARVNDELEALFWMPGDEPEGKEPMEEQSSTLTDLSKPKDYSSYSSGFDEQPEEDDFYELVHGTKRPEGYVSEIEQFDWDDFEPDFL